MFHTSPLQYPSLSESNSCAKCMNLTTKSLFYINSPSPKFKLKLQFSISISISFQFHFNFIMPSSTTAILSISTVFPDRKSAIKELKLSVSDLPMLSCQYIQKGVLLTSPPSSFSDLVLSLKRSLSAALSHFPALAGRLTTDHDAAIYLACNDAGVDFIEAKAKHLSLDSLLAPTDVPIFFRAFFAFDRTLSYLGHTKPLAAVQVTELADGVFIGCTVNHAVADGTSFWHFFNTFAEINFGKGKISNSPDFGRDTAFDSPAVLKFPAGGPKETFAGNSRLRERIFHFSREAILRLKLRANGDNFQRRRIVNGVENLAKKSKDGWKIVNGSNGKPNDDVSVGKLGISSFQSLSAQLWRSVTKARKLNGAKTTTFRMAVNCRHRLQPPMPSLYFGNAIQSIPTVALVGELLSKDLGWCGALLNRNVAAHDDATVRRGIADWEREPRLFPLGNSDGASMTMGSSPRFPMYNNDFGWGRPVAVRSGGANKFDGKISAFPGREGNGSVDLEVVLAPETMAALETDPEFMQYISVSVCG